MKDILLGWLIKPSVETSGLDALILMVEVIVLVNIPRWIGNIKDSISRWRRYK